MEMNKVGFETQRTRLLKAYEQAGQPITCRTIPYHSTCVFQFDVVNFAGASPGVGYAIARKHAVRLRQILVIMPAPGARARKRKNAEDPRRGQL